MNFDEFIKKYNGYAIDYDKGCGVQCVDLAKLYLDKVFGIKPGAWGNAHAYFDNYEYIPELYKNFDRIANTKEFKPVKGDICIWGKKLDGKYGHIAIADGVSTLTYFYTYDQNWGSKECKRVKHTYKAFLGVLRKKKLNKFKAGEKVEVNYKFTGACEYDKKLIEIEGSNLNKQVWIKGDKLTGVIAYAENNKYIVDFGSVGQMWINEENIKGKV